MDHLDRLFAAAVEEPWYRSFFHNLREAIWPAKLPPLELTSKPIPVRDIWGDDRYGKRSAATSIAIHVLAVVLLFTLGTSPQVRIAIRQTAQLIEPNLSDYLPGLKAQHNQGGGGGGDRSPVPASRGQAPRFADHQIVPPAQVVNNDHPRLLMEPTLVGPPDAKLPETKIDVWGDPLAKIGPYSNGPGRNGGIGDGDRGGIGPAKGPSYGDGDQSGIGPGVFRISRLVSAPVVLYQVEPDYSEEARKARFQGTVELSIVVDEHGMPTEFKVLNPLGMGLDEKAVEAVRKWRFRPGMKDGHPVAVIAKVYVTFRLL